MSSSKYYSDSSSNSSSSRCKKRKEEKYCFAENIKDKAEVHLKLDKRQFDAEIEVDYEVQITKIKCGQCIKVDKKKLCQIAKGTAKGTIRFAPECPSLTVPMLVEGRVLVEQPKACHKRR